MAIEPDPQARFQLMSSPDDTLLEAEEGMEKSVQYMMHEFTGIRTGKASPALVENLDVEAYGAQMKLKQMAVITTPEPRLLVVQPFDISTVKNIEKAIQESRLGINPAVDGKILRIPIPELSEERRISLAKTVKQMAEEGRVRIRAARRTAIDELKKMQKAGDITEDDLAIYEKDVQKLTDQYVAKIDEHLAHKEEELMRV